jgi:hypothetical protein
MIKRLPFTVYFFLFAALFKCGTSSYAQRFHAGFEAGVVVSQVSGDNLAGFNKPGGFASVYVGQQINNEWKVDMGIAYFQKGSRSYARPERGILFSYHLALDYVEVPFLIHYRYKQFWAFAGPSAGVLVRSMVRNQDGVFPPNDPESRPFRSYEIGGSAGLVYEINNRWDVVWRTSQSLLPVRKHQGNVVFRWNRGQYNTAMAFTFRYKFGNNAP